MHLMKSPVFNRIRLLFIGLLVGAVFFSTLSYAVFTEPTEPPPEEILDFPSQ